MGFPRFLQGKKTMLGSLAMGLLITAWSLKWVDDDTAKMLLGVVAAFTGVSLRLAIKKPR